MNILWFLNEFWFNGKTSGVISKSKIQDFKFKSIFFKFHSLFVQKSLSSNYFHQNLHFPFLGQIFKNLSMFKKSAGQLSSFRLSYRPKIWFLSFYFTLCSWTTSWLSLPSQTVTLPLNLKWSFSYFRRNFVT